MKKIMLMVPVLVFLLTGCGQLDSDKQQVYHVERERYNVYEIDSCEYIGNLSAGKANRIAHKGNCRFCEERRKNEMRQFKEELLREKYNDNASKLNN